MLKPPVGDMPNGLRCWQVGGPGQCLGAGKTRSQKNARTSCGFSSRPGSLAEINHANAKAAFRQQFKLQADIVGD